MRNVPPPLINAHNTHMMAISHLLQWNVLNPLPKSQIKWHSWGLWHTSLFIFESYQICHHKQIKKKKWHCFCSHTWRITKCSSDNLNRFQQGLHPPSIIHKSDECPSFPYVSPCFYAHVLEVPSPRGPIHTARPSQALCLHLGFLGATSKQDS